MVPFATEGADGDSVMFCKVALLTVIATAFLAFTWVGVDLLFPTVHGAPKSPPSVGRVP